MSFLHLLAVPVHADSNSGWPRSVIVPIPETTTGVSEPVISLNGTWKATTDVPEKFWENSVDPSSWRDIQVPGEMNLQNFDISLDTEYPYKKLVSIPADFSEKRLSFDSKPYLVMPKCG